MDRAEIFGVWDKIRTGIVIGTIAGMVAFAVGCSHNVGGFTIGTRAQAGIDPQSMTANISHTVRLYGIDAPEKQQEFGTKAREYLSKLIFDKYVRVHFREIDRYGRIVGRIYDGEKEINVQMIAAGMAWHYRQYSADKEYSDAETKARELKAGLWSSPVPVPPWQWRKIKKNPLFSR